MVLIVTDNTVGPHFLSFCLLSMRTENMLDLGFEGCLGILQVRGEREFQEEGTKCAET